MNNKAVSVVIFLFLFFRAYTIDLSSESKTYLDNYFGSSSYEVLAAMKLDSKDVYMFGRFVDKEKYIVDKAIVCSFDNDLIRNYLYIDKTLIQNELGEIILQTELSAYGWKIQVSNAERIRIIFTFFHNMGRNITDGPRIEWDQDQEKFVKLQIDPSQY